MDMPNAYANATGPNLLLRVRRGPGKLPDTKRQHVKSIAAELAKHWTAVRTLSPDTNSGAPYAGGAREWLCHEDEKGSGYSNVVSMGCMEVTGWSSFQP